MGILPEAAGALRDQGSYGVSIDGSNIIINSNDEEQISPPVWLVSNWNQLLTKKMKCINPSGTVLFNRMLTM